MEANIKLLEDRVQRVIRRLRDLSAERARLERENQELKGRLAEVEGKRQKRESGAAGPAWPISPGKVAAALREVIQELRGA